MPAAASPHARSSWRDYRSWPERAGVAVCVVVDPLERAAPVFAPSDGRCDSGTMGRLADRPVHAALP
ncbi:hypothetical protein [uncultured Thiohalocapsa sp.]|uniref:hypothetical protein n=1 Tax=uncultured Thiohalocapsa sp. TaxID=768990 RepID=UPI0025F39F0A|nr:hypothetical protein [uncultured Thiohalocapsa sp.]